MKWSRRTNQELVMALDTMLDSITQTLLRNKEIRPGKRTKIYYKARHSLAIVRVLIARFNADTIINLKRCMNKDELPWEHKRGSGTRGIMRRNWKAYVRRRNIRFNRKLTDFL